MEFSEILGTEPGESTTLEYKDEQADKKSVLKELVALANEDGGKLLYGVRESDGKFEEIQDVSDYSEFEESMHQMMGARVSPRLDMRMEPVEYEGKTVVGFEVTHQGVLHSVRPSNNRAYFPTRVGSTTDYMEGTAVREFYRTEPAVEALSDYEMWLDEVRANAHRIVYHFEQCEFQEIEGRVQFSHIVVEVRDEIQSRLSEPHRELDDSVEGRMSELLDAADGFENLQLREKRGPRFVGPSGSGGGNLIGDSEDEIIEKLTRRAEEVNEAASELKEHIANNH